jgi:glycosyltransferase involved in cell wall biosynthesis
MSPQRALIAIPAFNEQESIASVLQSVLRYYPAQQIVVVDDGSTDNTASIAKSFSVTVIQLPFNMGVGGAMRTSFLYASRNGYDAVVQLDADGQHDPSYIETLLAGLGKADLVVGSRFSGVGSYRTIGPRRWAMRFLAFSVSKIISNKMTDVTSGFRANGMAAISIFQHHYPSEYLGDTVESIVIAYRAGLVVTEVPVEMKHRQAGRPSQSLVQASLFFFRAVLILILALVRPAIKQ